MPLETSKLIPLLFLGLATSACGNGNTTTTPPAPSASATPPVVTSASTTPTTDPVASTPTAAPDAGATDVADDSQCGGSDIDMNAVLANRKCRTRRDAPQAPPNLPSLVKLTLTPSADKVAPGGHVDLTLEIANTSQTPVPLYFSGDLTLFAEVKDAKGTRVAPPAGEAPKNADPKCQNQQECRLPTSHVMIAPGGKARAKVGWDANKVAWPKTGPTECCKYHVDPVASGPLPAGTYKLTLPLPYEGNTGNPADPEITIKVAK